MEVMTGAPTWRTSSYTGGNGGNCVEVGNADHAVVVRDTKNRDGVVLAVTAGAWRAFAAELKQRSAKPPPWPDRPCTTVWITVPPLDRLWN